MPAPRALSQQHEWRAQLGEALHGNDGRGGDPRAGFGINMNIIRLSVHRDVADTSSQSGGNANHAGRDPLRDCALGQATQPRRRERRLARR